jgi:hypothetical protein
VRRAGLLGVVDAQLQVGLGQRGLGRQAGRLEVGATAAALASAASLLRAMRPHRSGSQLAVRDRRLVLRIGAGAGGGAARGGGDAWLRVTPAAAEGGKLGLGRVEQGGGLAVAGLGDADVLVGSFDLPAPAVEHGSPKCVHQRRGPGVGGRPASSRPASRNWAESGASGRR